MHRDRAQHEAHEPRQDPHACLAELLLDPWRSGERDVGQERRERDRHVDPDGRHHALRRPRQHHDRRDRPRSGEHRDAERHDAYVFLLDSLGLLDCRLPLLAAARLDHVERVEADQDTASDLEGSDRDAEQAEDEAATQSERRQGDAARPGAPLGHEAARLAAYMAWSALRSSSSVPASVPETATTPTLAVTEGVPRNTVRMPLTSRLAAACATSPSVSGISTPNSSPPSRPTTSAWRTALRIASATSRSTASPVA